MGDDAMEKSIMELIQDLSNDDEFVQEETCGILELRSDESVDPLIDTLRDKKSKKNVKILAARVLGAMDDEKVVKPLIDTLKDNNKMVRREASTSLSRMGEKAFDPLMEVIHDEDWKVRGAAAWSLGKIGDKRATEALESLLEDDSGFVRTGAKWALNSIENG